MPAKDLAYHGENAQTAVLVMMKNSVDDARDREPIENAPRYFCASQLTAPIIA